MTEVQREKLLGYLLSALDESESVALDREVAKSDTLHHDLNEIARELQPLSILRGYYEDAETPLPPGLTERTCARIWHTVAAESGAVGYADLKLPNHSKASVQEITGAAEIQDVQDLSQARKSPDDCPEFRFGITEPSSCDETAAINVETVETTIENSDAAFHESLLTLADNFVVEKIEAEAGGFGYAEPNPPKASVPEIIYAADVQYIQEVQEIQEIVPAELVTEIIAEENVASTQATSTPKNVATSNLRQRSRRKLPPAKTPAPTAPHNTPLSILLSIGIGALIAVIMFPVLNFVKDKVVVRVVQVFMLDAEDNLEKYKKAQEKSLESRERENVGSFLTAHTQWQIIPQEQPLVDSSLETLTPEVMESLPLPQRAASGISAITSVDVANDLVLLADPKSPVSKNKTIHPFNGECLFISEDQVYFRRIPTR